MPILANAARPLAYASERRQPANPESATILSTAKLARPRPRWLLRASESQRRRPQPAGWRIGWPRSTYLAMQRCVPYAEYGAHLALATTNLSSMR